MLDPRVEAGIDAILKARAWRDPVWGDSAIGSFDYSTKEDGPCYVIRDHEAERREQKTVVLHKTSDREENEREYIRAILRREIARMLPAMDAIAAQQVGADEIHGRYEIELPLRIGQGWDILYAVDDAEDVVEGTAALSTALIREAKLIERLPDEPGDYFDGEGA